MGELVNVSILFDSDLLIEVGKAVETMRQKYQEGFEKSMVTLRDMIKTRTPIAFGDLYNSIDYEMEAITGMRPGGLIGGAIGFVGKVRSMGGVGSSEPGSYVASVEKGTRPHWPPYEPLQRWVRAILMPGDEVEESRATFLVGRHIAKYGTVGQQMFERGREEFDAKNILGMNMKQAAEEGLAIIAAEKPWWAFR